MLRRRAMLAVAVGAAAAAVLTVGVVSCGDGEPYAKAVDGRIELRLDEYRVLPERVEAPAGRVRIAARNIGRLAHDVAVVRFERPLSGQRERRFARTRTALPGETVTAAVTLEPGRYRLVCTIANHDNLGQYGELRVVG